MLAQLVANMRALGVLDEHGKQVAGQMIRELQGMDGLFIFYVLFNHQLEYVELRELVEYLIDHDIIQRLLDRKGEDEKREWMRDASCASCAMEQPARHVGRRRGASGTRSTRACSTKIELIHQEMSSEGAAPRAARRQEAEDGVGAARGQRRAGSSSSSTSTGSSTRRATCSRTSCA